jgi:hypothetical protein
VYNFIDGRSGSFFFFLMQIHEKKKDKNSLWFK